MPWQQALTLIKLKQYSTTRNLDAAAEEVVESQTMTETKKPMLPIACAAKKAWYLGSWDRFMIPKPFTRVVVAVGAPVSVTEAQPGYSPSAVQTQMEQSINALMQEAKQAL